MSKSTQSMQQHKCLWPAGCKDLVPPHKAMCDDHWKSLPGPLRGYLWAYYRAGVPKDQQGARFDHALDSIRRWIKMQGARVDQGEGFTVSGPER